MNRVNQWLTHAQSAEKQFRISKRSVHDSLRDSRKWPRRRTSGNGFSRDLDPFVKNHLHRTFAAAPMFHAIWIIIYPVTTSRARRECRTPSQKPRKKGLEQARWLWLVYQRTKVTQICADSSERFSKELLFIRIGAFSISFIIVPFLSSS